MDWIVYNLELINSSCRLHVLSTGMTLDLKWNHFKHLNQNQIFYKEKQRSCTGINFTMTNFNLSVSSRLYAKKKKSTSGGRRATFPSSSKVSLHVEIIETVTNLEHYRVAIDNDVLGTCGGPHTEVSKSRIRAYH